MIATKVVDLEWPWTSIHCFVVSFMRVVTKLLRLESHDFCYKITLDIGYLHINSDDELEKHLFEFQASFLINLCPKLNWRALQFCRCFSAIFAIIRTNKMSSITAHRKSPTTFRRSLSWKTYVSPKSPKGVQKHKFTIFHGILNVNVKILLHRFRMKISAIELEQK